MKKETYTLNLNYSVDENRVGAKITFDGERFVNNGEFAEICAKSVLGYEPKKDANTPIGKGYDIPELKASVKSWNCGLTDSKHMPKEKKAFIRKYWRVEDAELILWVNVRREENEVDLYYLNRREFGRFLGQFASWDSYCEKVRIKKSNREIVKWLNEKVA